MAAAAELARRVGTAAACRALAVPRGFWYRRLRPAVRWRRDERRRSPRALAAVERRAVLDTLHAERFVDRAPAQVCATLLEEGTYLCSVRTMYRLLGEAAEVRERRAQRRQPRYAAPQLLATHPNQLWSWDITKLLGPAKWVYYYLYVLLDVFSRFVVGWLVAERESAELARRLLAESAARQGIEPGQLTVHSDRGSAMKSDPVAYLLATLGITKTHSRPHVANDNPFSEAHFKTVKYHPLFPSHFGSLEDALAFCRHFFPWYNHEHRHSALAWLTPAAVHAGEGAEILRRRHQVLAAAYHEHPERFVRGAPRLQTLPPAVWINPPEKTTRQEALPATIAPGPLPGLPPVAGLLTPSTSLIGLEAAH
jgi:putative transposase